MKKPHARRPSKTTPIKPTQIERSGRVVMSFRHLDLSRDKFSVSGADLSYFPKLFERFKAVCDHPFQEFCGRENPSLRNHGINWAKTTEPKGFSHLGVQLSGCPPFQFSVSSNKHGRVHGFILNEIFYAVWLDPDHNLYS